MSSSQILSFKIIDKQELSLLLEGLGYSEVNLGHYNKASEEVEIDIHIIPQGIIIHRSGSYFTELGLLVESLGGITEKLQISNT